MYIDAIKGSLIAFFVLTAAAVIHHGSGPSEQVQIILTVSTFLFAILMGFFIARLNTRFDSIRTVVASEDAVFLSFFKTATLYGSSFTGKIRDLIDRYYVTALDFVVASSYKHTAHIFLAIYDELYTLRQYRGESSFQQLLVQLQEIERSRNTYAAVFLERVSTGQWTVLILLAGITLFSIFSLKSPTLASNVVTVLLSTAVILVLLILRDLQNLRLGGQMILNESAEEVLEFIGKPRYYNHVYLEDESVVVPEHVREYRRGEHKPGEKPRIKLVKNQ